MHSLLFKQGSKLTHQVHSLCYFPTISSVTLKKILKIYYKVSFHISHDTHCKISTYTIKPTCAPMLKLQFLHTVCHNFDMFRSSWSASRRGSSREIETCLSYDKLCVKSVIFTLVRLLNLTFRLPCWQLARKVSPNFVWHMSLMCVQWKFPDDGQRNCPKHVELYSKNKF